MALNPTSFLSLEGLALLRELKARASEERIALLSAFNPEDVLLADYLRELDFSVPVFFLNTQKHFPETLRYVEEIRERCAIKDLRILTPDNALITNIDRDGELWQTQVNRCCWLRKVEPIERALKEGNFTTLITGRRQEQTPERGEMNSAEIDEHGRLKLNPLARLTKTQRDDEMKHRTLPHHPLYELGYPSIGCAPCTTPVFPGEDERAGRWRHTRSAAGQKTECGLHVSNRN